MSNHVIDGSGSALLDSSFFQIDDLDTPRLSGAGGPPEPAERVIASWLTASDPADARPVLDPIRAAGREDFGRTFASVVAAGPSVLCPSIREAASGSAGVLDLAGLWKADRGALDELMDRGSLFLRGSVGPVLCRSAPRSVLVYSFGRGDAPVVCGLWQLSREDEVLELTPDPHGLGVHGAHVRLAGARPAAVASRSEQSFEQLTGGLAVLAALVTASILGALDGCVDESFAYARERTAFGRPIIQHQAVSLRLADMVIGRDTLSLMMGRLADRRERRVQTPADTDMLVAHVSAVGHQVARDAMQVFAGHGYVGGRPVAAAFRQLKVASTLLQELVRTPEG